jgi:opacity protein-like surface antigen
MFSVNMLFLWCAFLVATSVAQTPDESHTAAIGVQAGIWKPISLDDNPSQPFKPVRGSDYAPGIYLITPDWQGISLRFTFFHWQHLEKNHIDQSTKLRHLSVDIKQQIISQARISPFMTAGLSGIYAHGREQSAEQDRADYQRVGYGINVGAGIDFILFRHWTIAIEYQYLYAKFDNILRKTDNYSGPNLSLKLQYCF